MKVNIGDLNVLYYIFVYYCDIKRLRCFISQTYTLLYNTLYALFLSLSLARSPIRFTLFTDFNIILY